MDFGQLLHAGTLISSDKSAAIFYEISHHFLRVKWSNFLLFTSQLFLKTTHSASALLYINSHVYLVKIQRYCYMYSFQDDA